MPKSDTPKKSKETYEYEKNQDVLNTSILNPYEQNQNYSASNQKIRRTFPGIAIKAIQHPFDAKATELLSKVPLLPEFLKFINKIFQEDSFYVLCYSSFLKISPYQYPRLFNLLEEAVRILDLKVKPELFIGHLGYPNAISAGVETPIIIISTEATEIFNEEELLFLIGSHVGLIKFGQNIYKTTANILLTGGIVGLFLLLSYLNAAPIANIVASGGVLLIASQLIHWERMTYFSGDRAGFLTVQDRDVALKTLSKIAGFAHKQQDEINIEALIDQAKILDRTNFIQTIHKFLILLETQSPFLVYRIKELDKWIKSEECKRILDGYYPLEKDFYRKEYGLPPIYPPYPQYAPYPPYAPYPQGPYPAYSTYPQYPPTSYPYPLSNYQPFPYPSYSTPTPQYPNYNPQTPNTQNTSNISNISNPNIPNQGVSAAPQYPTNPTNPTNLTNPQNIPNPQYTLNPQSPNPQYAPNPQSNPSS